MNILMKMITITLLNVKIANMLKYFSLKMGFYKS